jgi:hypothetical protein
VEQLQGESEAMMGILGLINLFFAIVIGLYFGISYRQQQSSKFGC